MFSIELAGYGVVRDPGLSPYPVFVISVNQPEQSWTCYRRYSSFKSLGEHLATAIGGLSGMPVCPQVSDEVLFGGNISSKAWAAQLEKARGLLQIWLHQTLVYPGVKESQVLRNFLCANANMPPAKLEITWSNSYCPSLDEMEMDELFDRHLEEKEGDGSGIGNDIDSDNDDLDRSGARHAVSDDEFDPVFGNMDNDDSEGGPSSHRMAVSHSKNDYYDATLDMPSEDDIASSVPVEITFNSIQPSGGYDYAMQGGGQYGYNRPSGLMGALGAQSDNTQQPKAPAKVGLDSFKIIKVIGKGSFGKVFLVREKTGGEIFAMKVLRKDNIIKRNQVEHTKTERNVLGYVRHPFIVGLNMAFQTRDKLFFVLDYCAGGELFFHLGKQGKFAEPRAKFYTAEIALALEHMHKLDIIYRDLKPENVLLDGAGHIRLTDFGLSKEGITNNTSGAHSFCGTPEYLAPEILNRQGHGRAVDWWSLGALLYEMLTGLPPFYCRDREKLFEKIRKAQLTYPRYLSDVAQDILHGLLTRDPTQRLGSSSEDSAEVKRHLFFASIDWDRMMRRDSVPPWEPTVVGSLDTSQFDKEFTSMPIFSPNDKEFKYQAGGSMGTVNQHLSATPDDNTFEGFTFVDKSGFMHRDHPPAPPGMSGVGTGFGHGIAGQHPPTHPSRTFVDFSKQEQGGSA